MLGPSSEELIPYNTVFLMFALFSLINLGLSPFCLGYYPTSFSNISISFFCSSSKKLAPSLVSEELYRDSASLVSTKFSFRASEH